MAAPGVGAASGAATVAFYRRAMASAWVYLLRCRDRSLYCGWSTDPLARAVAHNHGRGAAYTRSRLPVRLVWVEECADRSAALKREYAIKQLTRTEKLALVHGGGALKALRLAARTQP